MNNQEKVINGLECCNADNRMCSKCPYDPNSDEVVWEGNCAKDLARDALALMKAQEPKLFTLDDVSAWIRQKPLDREPIYVEVKDLFGAWMVDEIASYLPETDLSGELYGKTWRVWSAKPTEEQRKEAKWND